MIVDQAAAELAEHGVIEAGVGQLQTQRVLPVDASADGVSGLTIGQALDVLEDRDQGQPCRGQSGLAAVGEEIGELVITIEGPEDIGDAETEVAVVARRTPINTSTIVYGVLDLREAIDARRVIPRNTVMTVSAVAMRVNVLHPQALNVKN